MSRKVVAQIFLLDQRTRISKLMVALQYWIDVPWGKNDVPYHTDVALSDLFGSITSRESFLRGNAGARSSRMWRTSQREVQFDQIQGRVRTKRMARYRPQCSWDWYFGLTQRLTRAFVAFRDEGEHFRKIHRRCRCNHSSLSHAVCSKPNACITLSHVFLSQSSAARRDPFTRG